MTTTIDTWIAGSGSWFDPANWSNGVPTADSVVVIQPNAASTITFTGGSASAYSLTAGANALFQMSGGSLDVLTDAAFTGLYAQSGGTLDSEGMVTIGTGSLTGGEFTGTGTMEAGSLSIGDYAIAGSATLDAAGTVEQSGDLTLGGTSGSNAEIVNGGTWDFVRVGSVEPTISGPSGSSVFINNGWIGRAESDTNQIFNVTTIGSDFVNNGTIDATGCEIALAGATNDIGGILTGTNVTYSGEFFPGGIDLASSDTSDTVIRPGTVLEVPALTLHGTVHFEGDETYHGFLDIRGTLDIGSHTLDFTQGQEIYRGGGLSDALIGSAGGEFLIGSGMDFAANPGPSTNQCVIGSGITVENSGSFVQAWGGLVLGNSQPGNTEFINYGSYQAAQLYQLSDTWISAGSSGAAFVNHGVFTSLSPHCTIGVAFTNDGEINVGQLNAIGATLAVTGDLTSTGSILLSEGVLQILGQNNVLGGTISSVAYNFAASTLDFGGSSDTVLQPDFKFNSNVQGPIHFEIENAATISIGADMHWWGGLTDSATGTTKIDLSTHTLAVGTSYDIRGSTGEALITGSGPAAQGGALVAGYVGVIGNLVVGGSAVLWNIGQMSQAGDVTIGDTAGQRASILNIRGAEYFVDSNIVAGGPGESRFTNRGLFLKGGFGTNTSTVSVDFVTDGTVEVTSGTLEFTNALSNCGTIIADGGTFRSLQPLLYLSRCPAML